MTDPNRYASRLRPPPVKGGDAPGNDSKGDHIFRFPFKATPPQDITEDQLFQWVIEQQILSILDIVEFEGPDGEVMVKGYRFKNTSEFTKLDY